MAPFQQGSQFMVSPHGIHVATVQLSGSRKVLVYDGVVGPKFDSLFGQDGEHPVTFSPDNNHWAYCGQQGNEWVVMRDGAEFMRGPGAANGTVNIQYCTLGFSPNSQHLYLTSVQDAATAANFFRFVWDGKASPVGAPNDLRLYAFSPDGNHFAYIWNEPTTQAPHTHLYIDNKEAPYNAGSMQWSADSQHLYSVRLVPVPGSRAGHVMEALLDGRPFLRADGLRLFVPPAGNMVAAAVVKNNPTGAASNFLVIGGKQVPGSESPSEITNMVFSPDGKRYATLYHNGSGQAWFFSDGKKGQTYQGVGRLGVLQTIVAFTPDSSKMVYTATMSEQEFLIENDQESDPYRGFTQVLLAPSGNHVATAWQGQVTLDQKLIQFPGKDPRLGNATGLSFSPDGTRLAGALRDSSGISIFVDGAILPGWGATNDGPVDNIQNHVYTWSPDSKHVAYFCRSSNPAAGSDQYVCMDGKAIHLGSLGSYANLTFSADSNHLFWTVRRPGYGIRVFADGQPVFEGDSTSPGGMIKGTWEPGPGSSLLLLTQDQSGLKRVSITPSSTSGLASLF
jgi:WD40 repeat protein